jgi:hypothetical protein
MVSKIKDDVQAVDHAEESLVREEEIDRVLQVVVKVLHCVLTECHIGSCGYGCAISQALT